MKWPGGDAVEPSPQELWTAEVAAERGAPEACGRPGPQPFCTCRACAAERGPARWVPGLGFVSPLAGVRS